MSGFKVVPSPIGPVVLGERLTGEGGRLMCTLLSSVEGFADKGVPVAS